MTNSTDLRSELMLVNEEEAPEKLPPNMPNYDPFVEQINKKKREYVGPIW
jgi:hypothetical protein